MSLEGSTNPPSKVGRVGKASTSFSGFTTVTSSLSSRTSTEYANLYDGPVPSVREQVQNSHVSFVELHRGAKASVNSKYITTSVFIKNVLAMLLSVDRRAAILCYEHEKTFNSICHPVHVPVAKEEFARYFPRVYNTRGTMTVKCRVSSSMSIIDIKRALMEKLQKYHYYIRPTLLKAVRTTKVGWMYLAHPDLTYRHDFQRTLPQLILSKCGSDIEFQVSPEMEHVEAGNKKVSQRVLVVRCPYEESGKIRSFFMEAFAPESNLDIGYLARYTFIPNQPIGNCTKAHLMSIIHKQKAFHKNVFWYIWQGIQDIDAPCELLPQENISPEQSIHTEQTITQEVERFSQHSATQAEDVLMDTSDQDSVHNRDQPEPSSINDTVQYSSLKRILYEMQTVDGGNLIHAVYASNDSDKYFVLCSDPNKNETLRALHDITRTVSKYFVPGAQNIYFPPGTSPYVLNYPILNESHKSSMASLITLAGHQPNPQDDTPTYTPVVRYADALGQSQKRKRDGTNEVPTSHLPSTFNANTAHDAQATANLNETMARLKQIESNEKDNTKTLDLLSKRLDRQGQDITILGESLQTTNAKVVQVCDTQTQQGQTMVQMSQSLHTILQKITVLTDATATSTNTSLTESSQGGGVSSK